jgi:hypothetical protein
LAASGGLGPIELVELGISAKADFSSQYHPYFVYNELCIQIMKFLKSVAGYTRKTE